MNHYKQSYMAEYNLKTMSRNSKQMLNDLNKNRSLPDWAKSKLTDKKSFIRCCRLQAWFYERKTNESSNTGTTDRTQLYKTILLSGALVGGVYLYDKGIASKKRLKTLPEGADGPKR